MRFLAWLTLVLASAWASAQPQYAVLNPERLWQLVRIGTPAVSPDGRWAAFTVTAWADGASLPSIDLWLVATHGKDAARQLTRNPGADFDPAWAPDSQSLVYASTREGQEGSQIWLLNLRGGEPLPLTEVPASATRPRFSPDGASVLFQSQTWPDVNDDFDTLRARLAAARDTEAWAKASEHRLPPGSREAEGMVDHVFRLDLESGRITDLMPGFAGSNGVRAFEWDLSPNGGLLAFTGNTSQPPYRTRNGDVFLLPIREAGGQILNLTSDNPGNDFRPVFTRAGNALLFGRRTGPDALSEFNRIVRHELRDGVQRDMTDGRSHSPRRWLSSEDGRQVYFTAQERGRLKLFRAGGGRARPVIDRGAVSAFTLGPEDAIFYLHGNLLSPAALFTADRNGLHPKRLTRFNQPLMTSTRSASVQELEFAGAAGDTVHGWMVYPPGFTDGARWPLVIVLHGGPHSAWLDEFNWRWNLAVLASAGYLVAAINFHGSTGYGAGFAASIDGDPVTLPAEDVARAVEALTRNPAVDRSRIVLGGGSYGGLLGHWILASGSQFAAAFFHAGVFDLAAQYGTDFPWGRERTWGALPWRDPLLIDRHSPSRRAASIATPVLLLHGERDSRVAPLHSRYAHNVLTDRGIPSRLVLFPDEGHSLTRPRSGQRWWAEIFGWLERFAPPGPRQAGMP